MCSKIYAKSQPVCTINEHNEALLTRYEELKKTGYLDSTLIKTFDEVVKKVIYYHDLGKLNFLFQNKIRKSIPGLKPLVNQKLKKYREIPHEWLSLAFISPEDISFFKQFNDFCRQFNRIVRYAIAFHHTRTARQLSREAYQEFVKFDLEPNKEKLGITHQLKDDISIDDLEQKVKHKDYYKLCFPYLIFIKGILHKCDYTASADVEVEKKYSGGVFQADFQAWIKEQRWGQFGLRSYQKEVKEYSRKSVIFVASTGAGKTEYAMNWINGDKAFYLLGLRTAVNAMFNRFKAVFKEENVSLLHGETRYYLLDDYKENDSQADFFKKVSENYQLCYPITIATADQIVTSVFKYNSFERIYLTASYSKIIVDEIQSFSPAAIAVIVVFLQETHKLGARFLLMTATLPPFIREELSSLGDVIIPKPYTNPILRHRIKIRPDLIDTEENLHFIKKKLEAGKKVLLICNTVKMAQQMYALLEDCSPQLLHARFINRDRREKDKKILSPLKKGELWIATQIVEASLDIDFDVLLTECSPVDSLLQRWGRCYRNRQYKAVEPNIFIFKANDSSRYVYDPAILDRTYCFLKLYDNKLIDEDEKADIIDYVYEKSFLKNKTKYYLQYKKYKELLQLGYQFHNKKEAQELFRQVSNTHVIIPKPVYIRNQAAINNLLDKIEQSAQYLDKLQAKKELADYCLSLSLDSKHLAHLEILRPTTEIKLLNQVGYSFERGLTVTEQFNGEEHVIY